MTGPVVLTAARDFVASATAFEAQTRNGWTILENSTPILEN